MGRQMDVRAYVSLIELADFGPLHVLLHVELGKRPCVAQSGRVAGVARVG